MLAAVLEPAFPRDRADGSRFIEPDSLEAREAGYGRVRSSEGSAWCLAPVINKLPQVGLPGLPRFAGLLAEFGELAAANACARI